MKSANQDLRIVLVGKTGSGKSSTGNTILGPECSERFFKKASSAVSVTKTCEKQEVEIGERIVSVIDTPGPFDTTLTEDNLRHEIYKCVEMSVPGPHVFLLVIKVGRFTAEERNTVEWIQENFGEEAARYIIILFTYADQLEEKPLYEYISESNDLKALVLQCGGRFHSFNNKDMEKSSQVTELLKKIEKMVKENGGQHYTNEMYRKAQKEIEWEAFKQKAKDYAKTALTIGVGVVGVAAISTAGGPVAAIAAVFRLANPTKKLSGT